MFRFMWWPMMSKRKPSTLYCFAQTSTESISSFSIIRCSLAVFSQHELFSTSPPSGVSRW